MASRNATGAARCAERAPVSTPAGVSFSWSPMTRETSEALGACRLSAPKLIIDRTPFAAPARASQRWDHKQDRRREGAGVCLDSADLPIVIDPLGVGPIGPIRLGARCEPGRLFE